MATKRKSKRGRLHIRVSKELEVRAHEYAERHSTNLSALVTKHLLDLLAAEETETTFPEVEQI